MVQTIQTFDLFDNFDKKKKKKKKKRVNHFWQSVDAILEDVSMTDTIVWCKNILRLSSFSVPKIIVVDMCNQVKSCTKRKETIPLIYAECLVLKANMIHYQ